MLEPLHIRYHLCLVVSLGQSGLQQRVIHKVELLVGYDPRQILSLLEQRIAFIINPIRIILGRCLYGRRKSHQQQDDSQESFHNAVNVQKMAQKEHFLPCHFL